AENKGSIQFHEKYGFKKVGVIKESGYKFDRWLDSVFMQRILK
ncbi:MAG: GNAT family N-acetyltransferase, partial [Flavobacterium sp.]|nr:GNAT family N-acetyltransferase [Flavobacterium sp.]